MMNKPFKTHTIGVDIGGTKVNVGLVDACGNLLSSHKSPIHHSKKPKKVISDVLTGIDVCLTNAGKEAKALGIGIAGQVDLEGVVQSSPNLGWRNIPLKETMEGKLNLPVYVTNDVRAATWGEWHFGSGKGINDLAVLFVGTGVGGGVINGGKLLVGCNNIGGELGHITLVYEGRKCRCRNNGCLEAYVGGWALAERTKYSVDANPDEGKCLLSMAGSVEKITGVTVGQAYHEGDLLARRLVEETGRYLAAGVVSIVNAFNPCCLILGGGVIEGIPEMIQMVKDDVRTRALEVSVKELRIVKAALGSNAAVIGSAVLAQVLVNRGLRFDL